MNNEQLVEWELAGETKVLRHNLLQCYFVHNKSYMAWPGIEPRPPKKEAFDLPKFWGEILCGYWHEVIGFFNWPNPSSRTIFLGSTQPLRNLPGDKGLSARKADNLTAICELTV
jgi:hypothetical protein